MAEDCVDHAITLGRLDEKPCVTRNLHIHGYRERIDDLGPLAVYGSDAAAIQSLAASDPALAAQLDHSLPYIAAEVVWAAREEMARTVDDILSRRTRALFLNAKAAQRMIEPVANLLARELRRDEAWMRSQIESMSALAATYVVPAASSSD
jgi:glycerol-3-phosphate dehydrogenase